MKSITLIFMVAGLFACQFSKADIFTVTNNLDSGPGSLRQAIEDANTNIGSDKIYFDIPGGDVPSRTISLLSALPAITDLTIIDGTTQSTGLPFGISFARIQLTTNEPAISNGFSFKADSCEIHGFYINNFSTGINVEGTFMKIGAIQKGNVIHNCSNSAIKIQFTHYVALQGNLIGVDTAGAMVVPGTGHGINVINSYLISIGGKVLLANNIISGNNYGIRLENATFVDINSNVIGTNPAGLFAQPNQYGIYCTGVNNNIEIGGDSAIERNLISGNLNGGIYGTMSNSSIHGNVIGLSSQGENLGNGGAGIYFTFGASDNEIGGDFLKANKIAYNAKEAIVFQNGTCVRNKISQNSIFCNSQTTGNGGILLNFANSNQQPPTLSLVTPDGIGGITTPDGIVEFFEDDTCATCEGKTFVGKVAAASNGTFTYFGSITGKITATVTDEVGNTSSFAPCAIPDSQVCILAGFDISEPFCLNETITFTDQSITAPLTELSAWSWDFDDGATSTQQSPAHAFSSSGTYNVKLIVANSEGCSDTAEVTIFISEKPVADFTGLTASCTNTPVQFFDQSTAGSGEIIQRIWDFGDGDNSIAVNPTHTYTLPGNYTVTLLATNTFGCTDEHEKNIIIAPAAAASFTWSASGLIVFFTNTTSFNGPHTSEWDFGDGNTSPLDNTANPYASAGTYNVCLTIYDSLCQSESTTCSIIDVVTGLHDPAINAFITTYPNPAKDYLTISGSSIEIKSIHLTSVSGAGILSFTNESTHQEPVTFALPSLASGMYLLYLETNKGTIAKKVVIE